MSKHNTKINVNELNRLVEDIVDDELNNSTVNKHISKAHPDMDLKYNSLNIVVGKP